MKFHRSGKVRVIREEDVDSEDEMVREQDAEKDPLEDEEDAPLHNARIGQDSEAEKRFPYFEPVKDAWAKKPKKNWKPLSASAKHVLSQYVRRAKSSIMPTIPESRQDDVVTLIDRILRSSRRKWNERLFPKPLTAGDTSDLGSITATFDDQQRQNALLLRNLRTLDTVKREEEVKNEELKRRCNTLAETLQTERRRLESIRQAIPSEHATAVDSPLERTICGYRQGQNSFWRRPSGGREDGEKEWWKELQPTIAARFSQDKGLRVLIKRMSGLNETLERHLWSVFNKHNTH